MFYYLKGIVSVIDTSNIVIDCGGVGYMLTCSGRTMSALSGKAGSVQIAYTYMAVREDGVELYGFCDEKELSTFKLLITVSGVGPKAALSILSVLTPEKLSAAVSASNSKAISAAPGVGAKTAARIILELKDKLSKNIPVDSHDGEEISITVTPSEKINDLVSTLSALGYTRAEISSVMNKIDREKSLEDMVRDALKLLMK